MGAGRWDPSAYANFSASTATRSTHEIYSKRVMDEKLDPKDVAVRESRDSIENPESTAVIVAIDVTGSMGMIADTLARQGLGTLFTEILTRKPITDPHLMFMAIGDANVDRAPLQVSQFEADDRIIEQLTSIFLEHGGGGNSFESYNLPWYFATFHTSIDCVIKRGKKGYLFTVGDENAPDELTREQIKKFIGDDIETDTFSNKDLLQAVQQMYHVFHVVVGEGSHARMYKNHVMQSWTAVLGQNVLFLEDHTKLSEVIISAIEITEGRDKAEVAASWSGDTSLIVSRATSHLIAADTGARSALTKP